MPNLPNVITVIRVLLIPVIAYLLVERRYGPALAVSKRLTKKDYDTAYGVLEEEVKEYALVLEQEVYSYKVLDQDGDGLDNGCGYYGDAGKAEMIEEAQKFIDRPKCDGCCLTYIKAGGMAAVVHVKGCHNDGKAWDIPSQIWVDDIDQPEDESEYIEEEF